MTRAVGILGIGHYVPEKTVTNFDMEKIVDTEWIDAIENVLTGFQNIIERPRSVIREDELIVNVANARKTATRKRIAGKKYASLPAVASTRPSTNTSAPRLFVIALSVHANVRIRIAGTIALKPSGIASIQSLKERTRLTIK